MEIAPEVDEIVRSYEDSPFDFITILRSEDVAPGKRIVLVDGTHRLAEQVEKEAAARESRKPAKPPHPTHHTVTTHPLRAGHILDDLVAALSTAKRSYAVHGALRDQSKPRNVRRRKGLFDDARHSWVALDIDKLACDFTDGASVAAFVRDRLPEEFRNRRCAWNLTPSHILKNGKSRIRLYFALDRPVTLAETKAWLNHATIAGGLAIDHALWNSRVQENFLRPALDRGVKDPFPDRWGILPGELELVAVPEIDTSAIAAKSERRGLAATAGVVVDDPAYVAHALPRLFAERTVDRIDSDGRQNTFRFLAQDFQDRAFSQDVCEAACLHFFFHNEETADALRETLGEKGVARGEKIVAEVAALGEARDDVWLGREGTIDESDILSQIHQGYEGAQNAFGCKTFADEDASADFAAVDLDDEDNATAQSALDLWLAEPSDLGRYEALVTDMASRGIKRGAASRAVREAQLGAMMGVEGEASVVALRELATAPKAKAAKAFALRPFDIADFKSIPPRRFIFGHDYIRKFVSATTSPGGRGKSNLTIAEACCMACGIDFNGEPARKLRVLLWNGEDPREEIELRVAAWLQQHGETQASLGGRLTILSGRDCAVKLVEQSARGPIISAEALARFEATVEAGRFDVVTLDPAIKFMRGGENSNESADLLVSTLADVADKRDAAMMLVNHARKPSKDGDGTTTLADSRGASALTDAARAQRVLNAMSKAEATAWRIDPDEAWRYVRIGGPGARKANLAPGGAATWFEQRSEIVENGRDGYADSSVGVAVAWTPPGGPGCGTEKQEAIAEWLARKGAGELILVKDAAPQIGVEGKNFWRDVMCGKNRVATSRGFLVYATRLGAKGSLIQLIKPEPEFAAADEVEGDD